jgi:hypothetical protein
MDGNSGDFAGSVSERRIRELEDELERINGGPVELGFGPECSDEMKEKFLSSVLAYERAEEMTVSEALTKSGVSVKPPEEISDEQLHKELWSLIGAMALIGVHLQYTDHLSDRRLYELLYREILHEPTVLMPDNLAFTTYVDLVSSGSKEETEAYLTYYADERARRKWAKAFPGDFIPPHKALPYDRDRLLPQPRCCCHTGDGPRKKESADSQRLR